MKQRLRNSNPLWLASLLLGLVAIGLLLNFHAVKSTAQSGGGFGGVIVEVQPTPGTLSALPTADGPFYLEGKIYPLKSVNEDGSLKSGVSAATCAEGGNQLGVWRAWGFKKSDTIVSNQEFWLPCYNGVIEAQGVIGRTTLAIEGNGGKSAESFVTSGGLGTFRTAFGECQLQSLNGAPLQLDKPFRFELKETSRRPGFEQPQ